MAEATNTTILDLDALMDSNMDAIPDVPDYMNPPDGNYRLVVKDAKIESYEKKDDATKAKHNRFKIEYSVVATIECEGLPVPDGTLFNENFMATEQGMGFFKKQAIKILDVSDLIGVSIRDVLGSLKGVEFDARITNKKSKVGAKEYENCNVRPIPAAQ